MKQVAADLSLDVATFNQCFDYGEFRETVQADIETGQAFGVDATPAFFINGRFLSGAQHFKYFKTIIDEELAN